MKTFKVKDVVAAAILAALVFVLLRYVAIPTPLPDTTLSIHNAIIAFFAILYGPVVAFVGGFVGNLLVDITAGWGIWWSWIVPTGLFGLFIGLFCKFAPVRAGSLPSLWRKNPPEAGIPAGRFWRLCKWPGSAPPPPARPEHPHRGAGFPGWPRSYRHRGPGGRCRTRCRSLPQKTGSLHPPALGRQTAIP